MDSKVSLEALGSLMSTISAAVPAQHAPKKFKRIRGGEAPKPTASEPVSACIPVSSLIPTVKPSATHTLLAAPSANAEPQNVIVKTPSNGRPNQFKKNRLTNKRHIPADLKAAEAATFSPIPPSSSAPAQTAGTPAKSDKKKKQKQMRKNTVGQNAKQNSEQSTVSKDEASASDASAQQRNPPAKKQKKNPENSQQSTRNKSSKSRRRPGAQAIVRNLDARAEMVGVSKAEDDFSTLLLQHVAMTNKQLQRDLEEEGKRMMEEQKRQQELLDQQAAELLAPAVPEPSTSSPSTSFLATSSVATSPVATSSLPTASIPTSSLPTPSLVELNKAANPHQKPKGFVPRIPCIFFMKGSCFRETCTFRHDVNDIPLVPIRDTHEERKQRGVCKNEKKGTCQKGDACLFNHNLKDEPCFYYHLEGICSNGVDCRFGHEPITEEQHAKMVATANKLRESRRTAENAEVTLQMAVPSHGTQGLSLQ
ncbi:hypothetical protein BG004_002097 [Podila humilis]|nr:hypothetical protein BG004_002097 [Podila humilis]